MRPVPTLRIEGVVLDPLDVGEVERVAPNDAIPFRLEVVGRVGRPQSDRPLHRS